MNDTEAFILFYSNKCKHCKDFIISLQKLDTTLYNNFNKICVDNNPNIPKAIESVPTIIVPSHQYPFCLIRFCISRFRKYILSILPK